MHDTYGQGDQTLSRAATMVADAKADFDQMAAALSGQIDGYRSRWQGAGATAFFALHQAWTDKQRRVVSALDGFSSSLRVTESDNMATDEAQSQSYLKTLSRLGVSAMILVHHSSLEAAADDLRRGVATISARMDQLESELGPLRSEWSGAAQAAYVTAKTAWDSAIAEMAALLDQTHATVVASNAEYAAADQRGARAFGG